MQAPTVKQEISRFPCKERTCMPGSQTTPGRLGTRNSAPSRFAFRLANGVGTQKCDFRGSMAGLHAPLSTLRDVPRGAPSRMTRGQHGLLDLYRPGLSPVAPCRSPGALQKKLAALLDTLSDDKDEKL